MTERSQLEQWDECAGVVNQLANVGITAHIVKFSFDGDSVPGVVVSIHDFKRFRKLLKALLAMQKALS